MSTRDPYDDGRTGEGYDDYDRTPDDRGARRDRIVEAARRKVAMPGLLLQLFGATMIAFFVACGVSSLVSPAALVDNYYDWVEDMQKQQPPEQRQQLPPREDAVKALRIEGPIYGIVGLVSGTFIFIGGAKMRSLRGYGLAMAGSILSIFPGLCCCCVGLLPGIWGFIVLLNADVKQAFSLAAPREPL